MLRYHRSPKNKETMFRLDNLLERWTEIYAPMQHNPSATAKPEEKAFFLIDRWADQNEFQRTFNLLHKPSLCYCTTIEAQLAQNNPKQVMYQYNWYLACKQRSTGNPLADDEGAALAKLDPKDWNACLSACDRAFWADDPEAAVSFAVRAFAIAPFDERSLQRCADAVARPFMVATRDPAVGKRVVEYLASGRGEDPVALAGKILRLKEGGGR
jgi:hypothetical protein